MLKVNNRKVIRRLAYKSLVAAKSRNIIAVTAIALTALLFTTLFTIGLGTVETFQRQTIRQAGGDGHAALKYITDEQYNKVKNHPLIKEISYNRLIADSVDNPQFLKRGVEIHYLDDTGMKLGFCEPTTGSKPKAANEIITDTKTLDLLNVPHKIGATVPLTYTVKGKQVQTDFILSGYWESDPLFNVGIVVVSKAYMEAHSGEITYTYKENHYMSGAINAYIMFRNSWDIEGKLNKVITDSGYERENNKAPNYMEGNVNWAYLSSGLTLDMSTILAAAGAVLLIAFTGYLIIYNIFQISVARDIRFYGLLKTVGTTGRQIRRIISRQAWILSAIGTPIGLVLGFLVGRIMVPMVLSVGNLDEKAEVSVSLKPEIFLGAMLFALVTVFISTRKPGKIAAGVSPIEAVRYTEGGKMSKRLKKSTDGGKSHRMALSNLGRNKRRTVLSILSMSLSLILLNTVFTMSRGFDMDKFLSKSVDTDFLIGHADYFRSHFYSEKNELSESFVKAVQSQPGFEEGGRFYCNAFANQCSIDYDTSKTNNTDGIPANLAQDGKPALDLYGLEELPQSRMKIVEGEKDRTILLEKLKTGKYVIEGLATDDHGNVESGSSHFSIGDTITINIDGKSYSYILLAKAKQNYNYNTKRYMTGYFSLYLPAAEYNIIVASPILMTYAFNVADSSESEIERFVKAYTEKTEPDMNYSSKQSVVSEFENLRSILLLIGGMLSFIIGMIGVLNYVNSILTGIVARRREFAMLQSIGMTGRQLRKVLCLEGLYYAMGTILFSLVFGVLSSFVIVRDIFGSLWFFSYRFTLVPLLSAWPVLLLLAIAIPSLAYKSTMRQSVVERLREIE